MAPKLYIIEWSPPVRAVILLEKALGITLEHVPVDLPANENMGPEYLKINPQHTVPTLIDDDGTIVCDSHAIMIYLIDKYGEDEDLYPHDIKTKSTINARLFFETGCVFTVLRRIIQNIWHHQSTGPSKDDIKEINSAYKFLNRFLEKHHYVAGDNLTIADFSMISSIAALNDLIPIDYEFGNVLEWVARMERLPYYEANSDGLTALKEFLRGYLVENIRLAKIEAERLEREKLKQETLELEKLELEKVEKETLTNGK